MVQKNQYQEVLRGKISAAIAEARTASAFTHQGVKGKVLEILISKLFKPLLPSDIGIGTGQIVEQSGEMISPEMDIVLYDRSIVPPILIDGNIGMFPIEAVLYTIEVKTTLTATDIASAHDAAKNLTEFRYIPGLKNPDGSDQHHSIEKVRSVVFSLNSDLTGSKLNEAARYEKIYKAKEEPPYIRAICVSGREYWYDNGERWVSLQVREEYDEILSFIGGVTNTYKDIAKSRHHPLLGYYIIPTRESLLGPVTNVIKRIEVTCSRCGKKSLFLPNLGTQNIIVNGRIRPAEPCASCGGPLESEEGSHEFKNGKLV